MQIFSRPSTARNAVLEFLALLILATTGLAGQAYAQQTATQNRIYVVSHVDVVPEVPTADAVKLLRQYATESRKENGAVRIEVYAQISRKNHFSMVEVWQNEQAFEAHEGAAHTKQFRADIQPMLGAPYDERLHHMIE